MRLRDVKGKRIVGVRQTRFYNRNNGHMSTDVYALILDDGTEIRPMTVETDGSEYAHELVVAKPHKAQIVFPRVGTGNRKAQGKVNEP